MTRAYGGSRLRPALLLGVLAHVVSATWTPAFAQVVPRVSPGVHGYELMGPDGPFLQEGPQAFQFERALFNRVTPERAAAFGEVRVPVVLVLFADSPTEPHVTRQHVQDALFGIGTSARGTITESYLEMSRGVLTVEGDAYGWARSDLPLDSVMGTEGSRIGERTGEFFVDALEQLDPDVDFTLYDNDGPDGIANSGDDDGYVDLVTFEYLEVAMSCGGPAIWPHRSNLNNRGVGPFLTDDIGVNGDTIRVLDYITQSATDCTGENVQDAAVITHEFGHALGLPDWYHWVDPTIGPEGRRWVLGCWALMAAGSWGCGPVGETREPYGPAHMIGFSKSWLGWITPVDPGEVWNEPIELTAIQTAGAALRIPLDDVGREYLWIEFRDTVGFDHQLPAPGVLMYREDTSVDIRTKPDPSTDNPYPLTMLERDDNRSLLRTTPEGGSRGEAGDAWGVGGVSTELNAESSPSLLRSNGTWSSVQIHEVRVEGDRAHLVISTGRTPQLVAPETAAEVMQIRTFYAGVRVAGGLGPYEGVGSLPEGFWFQGGGDELMVVGSLSDETPQVFIFAVRDSGGNVSNEVSLEVVATSPWVVTLESLLQPFLVSAEEPLTPGERSHLDTVGNGNGRYDVGDLRRWLRDNR
jgi:M6 family metalloprotease-like protein